MSKIVSFGEIMLRLNPAGYRRFYQANQMEVSYAGSEANVAVQLALLGHHSVFVSKVPAHEIGQCGRERIAQIWRGRFTQMRAGRPAGWGYIIVEKGASQRGGKGDLRPGRIPAMALARAERVRLGTPLLQGADWIPLFRHYPRRWAARCRRALCLEAVKDRPTAADSRELRFELPGEIVDPGAGRAR